MDGTEVAVLHQVDHEVFCCLQQSGQSSVKGLLVACQPSGPQVGNKHQHSQPCAQIQGCRSAPAPMRSRSCCIRRDFFQLPLILGCLCEAEGQLKHAKGTVRGAAQSYSLLAKAVTAALTSCRASSASPVHLKGSGATSLVISRACSRGQFKAQLQPVTLHWRTTGGTHFSRPCRAAL